MAAVLSLLWLVLVLPSPAAADLWYQHYQRAERALEREEWADAVNQLNQAIERRGDSGVRVRTYGMRTTDYLPYLKLGVAYHGLGQSQAALQAFETEERLGAVERSESGMAELERYRSLAREERDRSSVAEADRRRQVAAASLAEARGLAREGRLDEALEALARGQAVAPEEAGVQELSAELRSEIRLREQARETDEQVAAWTRRGRERLSEGDFAEAASLFRQALETRPDEPELTGLLSRAQAGLRSELESVRREEDRRDLLEEALAEARDLEGAGDLSGALARLQPVLAAEPDNETLAALARRLTVARAAAELDSSRRQAVLDGLAEGEARFGEGSWEAAVASANLVLASDPGNEAALELLNRAYRRINEQILGSSARGNLPPAIRFADFRDLERDGVRWQEVDGPGFRLTGVVIDESPVELAIFADGDRAVEVTAVTSQPLGEFHLTEFQLIDDLEAGPSTYRLVATDIGELTATSRYMVVYVPPIHRAAWFWGVLGVLGMVGVSVLLLERRRRRNRLRRRRFNPYIAGAPVLDEELFFGRDRLADRILQTIHNNSLLIYGERRIGKTSLQHYLKRRLELIEDPSYRFHPVFVDLQGVPEERFFGVLGEEVFEELGPVLEGLEPQTDPGSADYDHRAFVRDLRAVLKVLKARTSKKVKLVLLVDEVDELNDYDPRINQRLRSLFMKSFSEHLVAVVSGVEIKKEWEREGSPWYNFFEEIEMEPLSEDEARELIERPIRGALKLEPGVVEEILRRTGCRPYRIQKTCVALVNRAYEQGRRTIRTTDLDAIGRKSS